MSTRNLCEPKKSPQSYRSQQSINEANRYKLPSIHQNSSTTMSNGNSSMSRPVFNQMIKKEDNSVVNGVHSTYQNPRLDCSAAANASTPSYKTCKSQLNSSSGPSEPCNSLEQTPFNRGWASSQFVGFGKPSPLNSNGNKNYGNSQNNNCPPRPMTSTPKNLHYSSSKTVVRDRQLANDILQKAGISSNLPPNDCLEVITDTPVTSNENVNCDPNPLCMRKPTDSPECYEQSIVVRHLQPPRPPVPPPIIIREHFASQPPPPPAPIIIRQIPPRPATPPALIIRECPPPMPNMNEPTIIDREVPAPPAPPRQVIVERLPTPATKPRQIIFEKWLPYEEPPDRPCIVEKASIDEMPPPKNVIIQYEAVEPKIQPQCINEGVSFVDPKEFVNEKPIGNAEICYVDQLNNLPDHIKCQLGPQALAAIGLRDDSKQSMSNKISAVRTNPPPAYQQQQQQQQRVVYGPTSNMLSQRAALTNGCRPEKSPNTNIYRSHQQQGINRAPSTSNSCLSSPYDKYNSTLLARAGNQGLMNIARAHYNPWATTYQVSYNNRSRTMGRAR